MCSDNINEAMHRSMKQYGVGLATPHVGMV